MLYCGSFCQQTVKEFPISFTCILIIKMLQVFTVSVDDVLLDEKLLNAFYNGRKRVPLFIYFIYFFMFMV